MTDRKLLIEQLRAEGLSYAVIGVRLGVSRQRVWQIANAGRRRREIDEIAREVEGRRALSGTVEP